MGYDVTVKAIDLSTNKTVSFIIDRSNLTVPNDMDCQSIGSTEEQKAGIIRWLDTCASVDNNTFYELESWELA